MLFCPTFVKNNKTITKPTPFSPTPSTGIPTSSRALNSAGDWSQKPLFFKLLPSFLLLVVWLFDSGCTRHLFPQHLSQGSGDNHQGKLSTQPPCRRTVRFWHRNQLPKPAQKWAGSEGVFLVLPRCLGCAYGCCGMKANSW